MEIVGLALVALAVVAVVVSFWVRHTALPVLSRYVVTLTTGEAFEGLLKSRRGGVLVLVDAYALDDNTRLRVDGDLFLDRSKVAYMQRPGGDS